MNIIICVDKNGGMMFNGRRQTQDSVLREKVIEFASSSRLLMNSYSAKQFGENTGIIVDEDFLNVAKQNDFCFVENCEIPLSLADNLYIFNWNRKYPGDFFFDADLKTNGFKKTKREEFAGSSHEKITLEIYSKG